MTKNLIIAVMACLFVTASLRGIDSTWNYAVEINAAGQASPAQISLGWKQDTNGPPASYAVYRKPPTATSWGNPLVTFPGSSLNFTDTNVAAGTVYEYQIVKDVPGAPGYKGYGYIQAGINVPLVDRRGTVILVVDRTYVASLATELRRLEQDLIGDGWVVVRHDVGRNDSVVSVKNLIRADYSADPANVNTVFLFGHVPVPYSGLLNPDGHPDDLGAWPADVYYGDLDGQWTDSTVNWKQTGNADPADAARLTQRNTSPGLYQHQVNASANMIHIALMGDPTLRLHPVAPASGLSGAVKDGQVNLNWAASPDAAIAGYHIFRAASANGPFTRLTSSPSAAVSFTDSAAPGGATYMVRAVKLENTPSGSYFNASQGIFYTSNAVVIPAPAPTPSSRLVNLSVRSNAGSGSQTLIVGFVIIGSGNSGALPLLVRATGPALEAFGVDGVLRDPILTMYKDGTIVGFNDNWGLNAAQVSAAGAAAGAFQLLSPTSADAALTALHVSGAYSAQISGSGGASGIALAEVYDTTPSGGYTTAMARLTNISARTQVGTGANVLIVGFVVSGSATEKVLVRGIGRGLEKFGVSGVLANPQLRLFASNGTVLATNDGWGGDSSLAAVFTQVGAFALDTTSADSALVATLSPGAYTVQISGANGSTGVVLAEVYEVK